MIEALRGLWTQPLELPRESARDRIFVTGVYGSGKSFFARRCAARRGVPFLSFDDQFDYAVRENQSRAILGRLPPAFVMDAIPIDEDTSWNAFADYEGSHDVMIVCVYCPDALRWLNRVAAKADRMLLKSDWEYVALNRALPRHAWRFARRILGSLRRSVRRARRKALVLNDANERKHLREYRDFYTRRLAALRAFRHVIFYDSLQNGYTTEAEMLRRMRAETFPLHDRLDQAAAGYDALYQDIEVLNAVGYSESHKTWESLRDLVPWRGQRVTDLGCFHGYFVFKVEDCGGGVRGLDRSPAALETARMINELRGGHAEFSQWTGGDPIPECDVILCLNVLHHFGDAGVQEKALTAMRCRMAVFEIYAEQLAMIERHFRTVTRHRSHRKNRVIALAVGPLQDASSERSR